MHLVNRSGALAVAVLAAGVSFAQEAKTPGWATDAATAVRGYQKKVSASLQPLYEEWRTLADKAANAPGGPPGSLVPPAPVDTLDAYRARHVLAALPDKWRVALMASAVQARDRGAKAKADGKPAEADFAPFQAEFAGKPRAIALPRLPEQRELPKDEVALDKVLDALEKAEDEKGASAYRTTADRFAQGFKLKVEAKVRDALIELKEKLAKVLPESPGSWKNLPPELSEPVNYYLASAYFEGHGGISTESSSTGTGDGNVAATSSEGGTGEGKASEPGPSGTGSGDVGSEPGPSGTGSGKSTPKQFKDMPGTGSGKDAKEPGTKGTGGS